MVIEKPLPSFEELGLDSQICETLKNLGYETPTPIQSAAIPLVLSGKDLIGQAQTGTGKTAAFALPLLSRLPVSESGVQVLVLAPTRELAIQVAEAFESYACHRKHFRVVSIYGGQPIVPQIRRLERKPHVVVGTPGRVLDHMRRGTLSLSGVRALVLDEADEMLSMGFFEDIQSIIEQTPETRQTILFSATMPKPIFTIAERYLKDPGHIVIERQASDRGTIQQSHWLAEGMHKLDALTRILEVSDTDGTLVFVRTKTATQELTEQLEGRGYSAAALSGDLSQDARERTVRKFKDGGIDIIVATDVAARGLDVDRINCVVNYDIPFDAETYTHRIGRTGRAGRTGQAILFVSPRERGLLRAIERGIQRTIPVFQMPTRADVNAKRLQRLQSKVESQIKDTSLAPFTEIVEALVAKTAADPIAVASALCSLLHKATPLVMEKQARKAADPEMKTATRAERPFRKEPRNRRGESGRELDRSHRPHWQRLSERFSGPKDIESRPADSRAEVHSEDRPWKRHARGEKKLQSRTRPEREALPRETFTNERHSKKQFEGGSVERPANERRASKGFKFDKRARFEKAGSSKDSSHKLSAQKKRLDGFGKRKPGRKAPADPLR